MKTEKEKNRHPACDLYVTTKTEKEAQKNRHPACALGRERRKKYEGKSEKRCGTTRMDEARKWDE